MNKLTKATIERVYWDLERLAGKHGTALRFLEQAYTAACEGEKAHRRFGRSLVGQISRRGSVHTAACYFAARFALQPGKGRTTWADAASLRPDALNGHACGQLLRLKPEFRSELRRLWATIEPIDYSKDIAGNP